MKRVTFEKEQIEATYRNEQQQKYHKEQHTPTIETSSDKRTAFEKQAGELMEKARLHLIKEEVERKVAEKIQLSKTYPEPAKSLTMEASVELTDITTVDEQAINLGEYIH